MHMSAAMRGLKRIPSTAGRRSSALLIAVPIALLAWSIVTVPHLTKAGELRQEALPPLPNEPVLLYRSERTRFYYTASDLLQPEAFGKPGQFISAVVYDVWPTAEAPKNTPGQSLTWYFRIWRMLRGPEGSPAADAAAAESFRSAFGQDLRLDRGGAQVAAIAPDSTYRRRTGITHFAALGIRIPEDKAAQGSATPQQFPQAAASAFGALSQQGSRGVGIPSMIVRRTLGEEGTRDYSWSNILREVDALAPAAGIATVLYGGWGLTPGVREPIDSAFRTAWSAHKVELAKRAGEIVHEQLRLGALLVFGALLTWHLRRTAFTWQRVLALAALAGGLTYSIAQAGAWAAKGLGIGGETIFVFEAAAALLAGALIERIVRFDPKKILAGD